MVLRQKYGANRQCFPLIFVALMRDTRATSLLERMRSI